MGMLAAYYYFFVEINLEPEMYDIMFDQFPVTYVGPYWAFKNRTNNTDSRRV